MGRHKGTHWSVSLCVPWLLLVPAPLQGQGPSQGDSCDTTQERDSGGDSCSFYTHMPEFCGCCDTPSFQAEKDCCGCSQSLPEGTAAWWTKVLLAWPRKAVSLTLVGKGLQGELPENFAERWPNLTQINLADNQLSGPIPAGLGNLSQLQTLYLRSNSLSGPIPAELAKLSELQQLYLDDNQLSGPIPAELGSLSQLQRLDLDYNQLSGPIPAGLGSLSQLQRLDLDNNQFSGPIPAGLGNLSQLLRLDLRSNSLSGPIPAGLGSLSQLQSLSLNSNSLSGPIPAELGNLSRLLDLYLHNNQLSGAIPAGLGGLSQLQKLYLQGNQLSGLIPAGLGGLSQLQRLSLYGNHLSGPIPAGLGNLRQLRSLSLSSNSLSGPIPAGLGTLSQLQDLQLQDNQLSGPIPAELANLSRLQKLGLRNNQLSGAIPAGLGGLSQLQWLFLYNNQLSGPIPAGLGNLSQLQRLFLHGNQLSGPIPAGLGGLSQLQRLSLYGNHLSGLIPVELAGLSQLQLLYLYGNKLSGPIPAELGGLSQLQQLYLYSNQLSGPIPAELGGLSQLQRLHLADNQLSGPIPAKLGDLSQLELLYLADNQLSGPIPRELGGLSLLRQLYLANNILSGPIPAELRLLLDLEWVYLQNNQLSGPIPVELGRLWGLERLYLHTNRLSGPIPASLGGLSSLWELDLHNNKLSSPIPAELGGLRTLRKLNLANNTLSGPIPVELGGLWRLQMLHLHDNQLSGPVSVELWGHPALELLDIRSNPALRLPIQLDPASACPAASRPTRSLVANPQGWKSAGASSECTSLCPGLPQVLHDSTVQEEVLCRCSTGLGTGLNCTACPNDTYSVKSFDNNTNHYVRRCHTCPKHSKLQGFAGQCFADCSCLAGYFMQKAARGMLAELGSTSCHSLLAEAGESPQGQVSPEGQCHSCGIWKTSKAGSRSEAECFCDEDRWSGLFQEGAACRCPDGQRIDFARRSCVPCGVAEVCTDWTRLQPPEVKAGFWTLPPPPQGSDGMYGNFSSHSIWRCDSQKACPGTGSHFSCGLNRTGTACSLCQQGFFRTPGGACLRCPETYTATRLILLGVLIAGMLIPLLIHGLLSVLDESARSQVMTLRAFRVSLKQVLKFAQTLTVVSLLQVEWPALAISIFEAFGALSFDLASWMGVACLDAQQQETVLLEFAFRWMLPVLAATVTAASAVAARTCGRLHGCLRRRRGRETETETKLGRFLEFRFLDVLRVLLFLLQLFYLSVLKNAVLPLTCSPSPNGHLTLNMYPHVICWDLKRNANFRPLALLGGVFAALLIGGYPLLLFRLMRRLPELPDKTSVKERQEEDVTASWWTFVFDDYRPDCRRFVLVVVGKDILLNLIAVVLPGLGTYQLLVIAMVSSGYAFHVHTIMPFHDTSNTVLEACTSTAVAILCFFSAGMGFQSEAEVLDISSYLEDGRSSPAYIQRAVVLVCLQTLSLLVPAALITFQVLATFECTRRHLPRALLPATEEELQAWRREAHIAAAQLDHVALTSLHGVLRSSAAARRSLEQENHKEKRGEHGGPEEENMGSSSSTAHGGLGVTSL